MEVDDKYVKKIADFLVNLDNFNQDLEQLYFYTTKNVRLSLIEHNVSDEYENIEDVYLTIKSQIYMLKKEVLTAELDWLHAQESFAKDFSNLDPNSEYDGEKIVNKEQRQYEICQLEDDIIKLINLREGKSKNSEPSEFLVNLARCYSAFASSCYNSCTSEYGKLATEWCAQNLRKLSQQYFEVDFVGGENAKSYQDYCTINRYAYAGKDKTLLKSNINENDNPYGCGK